MILRFAEGSSELHPSAQASEHFARLVEEKSQGKIRIKVYFKGRLGNTGEVLEQLKFGGIALGRVDFASLNAAVPAINEFSSKVITKPLFCRDKIIENMEFIGDKCLAEKFFPLAVFFPDQRCFYTDSSRYFTTFLQGFYGVKIGTQSSPLIQNELKKYGALPLEAYGADTYQSMQKGFFNVREGDLCDFVLGDDYHFTKYIMLSDYISNPTILLISNEVWNKLSLEEKKILRDSAWEAASFQEKMMERFYTANMGTIRRHKKVITLKGNKAAHQ